MKEMRATDKDASVSQPKAHQWRRSAHKSTVKAEQDYRLCLSHHARDMPDRNQRWRESGAGNDSLPKVSMLLTTATLVSEQTDYPSTELRMSFLMCRSECCLEAQENLK